MNTVIPGFNTARETILQDSDSMMQDARLNVQPFGITNRIHLVSELPRKDSRLISLTIGTPVEFCLEMGTFISLAALWA